MRILRASPPLVLPTKQLLSTNAIKKIDRFDMHVTIQQQRTSTYVALGALAQAPSVCPSVLVFAIRIITGLVGLDVDQRA